MGSGKVRLRITEKQRKIKKVLRLIIELQWNDDQNPKTDSALMIKIDHWVVQKPRTTLSNEDTTMNNRWNEKFYVENEKNAISRKIPKGENA